MFSNFKLPSFLHSITSSQTNQNPCNTSINADSHLFNHSMQKFYTDFAILGEQNKLKNLFSKKTTNSFFTSSNSQSDSDSNDQNRKAQIIYLKKKQPLSRYIEVDKQSYDHVSFKLIFFDDKSEKQFQDKLIKQMKCKTNAKKAVFCRNLQFPVSFYVEEVNSICSRHKCVYVVYKRWSMGLVEKFNGELFQSITSGQPLITDSFKKISLRNNVLPQNKPFQYKQSTTNTSKHSQSMRGVNSPPNQGYNYDQSLVNQLNFDKVKSPMQLGGSFCEIGEAKEVIARELLIMIKCGIRSLEFLKNEGGLPSDLNLGNFLWEDRIQYSIVEQQAERQASHVNQQKKIQTTLTNRFESYQSLAHESYLVVNPSIPKPSIAEMLKLAPQKLSTLTQQKTDILKQTINKFIPLFNEMLLISYPSPQELMQPLWESESMYSSLLFKLGMTVLDVWVAYQKIINRMIELIDQKQSNYNEAKTIKEVVYLRDENQPQDRNNQVVKIDWLQVSQLMNGNNQYPSIMKQERPSYSQQSRQFTILKKVLKMLLSRSAIQRKAAFSLVSSRQFISVISRNTFPSDATLSKTSSNRTQSSQQREYRQRFLMAKHVTSNSHYNELKYDHIVNMSSNTFQTSPRMGNPSSINKWQGVKQQKPHEVKLQQKNRETQNIEYKQSQKPFGGISNFNPKNAYLKVINEDKMVNTNQTLSQQYLNHLPQKNNTYQYQPSIPQYQPQESVRFNHQNNSFSRKLSQFTYSETNHPYNNLKYSTSNQSIPEITPSKYGKQTIITHHSQSLVYPTQLNISNHQYTPQITNQLQSLHNPPSSSQYCTPTFADESTQKAYLSQGAIRESPKPPVKLFSSFNAQVNNQLPASSQAQRVKQNECQKSSRDSPVHDPQLKVQISSSDKQFPSCLPQSSSDKINSPSKIQDKASLHYQSNDKILIQQDPQTSQKKISITEQLFSSIKPEMQSNQQIPSVNTSNLSQGNHPCKSSPHVRPKSSSSHHSDIQQAQYVSEEYKGGGRYEGYVKNKKRHGYGRLDYHEGSRYEGDWVEDRMNGYGKLYYSNESLAYEGYWQEDEFHGSGKVYNDNPTMLDDSFDYTNFNNLQEQWVHYEGELQHDLKEGHGIIMLENGEWFEGEFHNDRINGEGKFVNLEGEVIYGRWKDNIMVEEYSN